MLSPFLCGMYLGILTMSTTYLWVGRAAWEPPPPRWVKILMWTAWMTWAVWAAALALSEVTE